MKIKKCPYCGKRISYVSSFSSRRKGEYVCERCGKESKVIINKSVIFAFIVTVLISLVIMGLWIFAGLVNNPLGILLVAVPLIIFAAISPKFLNFEPLKKYKKSMEAKKEGIAYSDNLITSELDEINSFSFPAVSGDSDEKFQINSDVFNKIKEERTAARKRLGSDDNEIVSDSGKINEKEEFVSIIDDVSENHNYADAPLKKIHSENSHTPVRRNHHYISESDGEENISRVKKTGGNRYSSNRKF